MKDLGSLSVAPVLRRSLPEGLDTTDEAQCVEFIEGLDDHDYSVTQEILTVLLERMAVKPPEPQIRLRILEAARPLLESVQAKLAESYSARPTPIGSEADRVLQRVVDLWRIVARAYAEVARVGGTQHGLRNSIALLCQRCVLCTARVVEEYFLARREIPPGAWADVNGYYLSAEELGLSGVNVAHSTGRGTRYESCAETYAALLLVDLANPYSRTPAEMVRLVRWSRRFSRAITLGRPRGEETAGHYGLDLNRDEGPKPLRKLSEGHYVRHVDVERLREAMVMVQSRLGDGGTPSQLGLGKDCTAEQARRQLSTLSRLWCGPPRVRRFPRHPGNGTAELVKGFENIFQLVNRQYRAQTLPRRRATDVPAEDESGEEAWRVEDQAVGGFRLSRRSGGGSLGLGDMVGLQFSADGKKLLCRVSWIRYRTDGVLDVGLYMLPGAPQCVSLRVADMPEEKRWQSAFLLPGLALLKQEATLVLPPGCYPPQTEVEIKGETLMRVCLGTLVSEGPNFERLRFKVL